MNNDEIFFIIDSNKLDSVHEKLYGYKIINSHYKTNLEDNFQEYGHFIDIKLDNNYIYITQDYLASWGIYIFKDKEYFAISNSFIMLAEYLKNYFKLSFNYDYANALFAQGLIVTAYKETMINEISILPSNAKIIIEKKSKNIIIDLQNIRFNYIDIDSYESIKIIDTWFLKWINFIKCIKEKTNKIRIDLSGGIDSRITFLLALKSNINLNDIQIYSAKDDLHTHKEDFEIANNICNFYNIKINNKLNNSYHHLSMKDSIENSFRIKLCFHNQMYYKTSYCIEPIFRFSGGGGETLRNYWNESSIKSMISAASKISNQMGISVNKIISNSFQALNVDNFQNDISPMFFYRAIRARNHFGKSAVEDFIANIFTIMPLLDPLIQKIKFRHIDNNLLAALIFKRYEEKLLDFKFDSNRKIDNKCLSIASKINNKFPFNKNTFIQQNYNIISHKNKPNIKKIQKTNRSEIEQFLRKIIYTNDFKNLTSLIFSNDVYDDVVVFSDKKIFSPLSKFISVLASILVYKIVILSKSQHLTTYDLLTYFFNIDSSS